VVLGCPLRLVCACRDHLNTVQNIKAFAISVFTYRKRLFNSIIYQYIRRGTHRMDQGCLLMSPKIVLHPSLWSTKMYPCSRTVIPTWGINVFLNDDELGKFIHDQRGLTNRERKSCMPIVDISTPSIMIRPLIGSTYG
jgi:hypothetical protein